MATQQEIGNRIAGFGAGFRGRGGEFLQGLENRETQQRQQRQQLTEQRRLAMLSDFKVLNEFVNVRKDAAGGARFLARRIKDINRLGGDPSQSVAIQAGLLSTDPADQEETARGIKDIVDTATIRGEAGFEREKPPSALDVAKTAETEAKTTKLLKEIASPEEKDKTSLITNLKAAGLKPGTKEFRNALLRSINKPTTSISLGTPEGSFAKEFGKVNAQQFLERRKAAQDAAVSLAGNVEAIKLMDEGLITGFGAEFKLGLGKALQQAGIHFADDDIANTEAFVASTAKQVAAIIKAFGAGTGLSDADREFATKAAGGNISFNEKSIRRILDINDRASRGVIKRFNKAAESVPEDFSPFPLRIDLPEGVRQPETQRLIFDPQTGGLGPK